MMAVTDSAPTQRGSRTQGRHDSHGQPEAGRSHSGGGLHVPAPDTQP